MRRERSHVTAVASLGGGGGSADNVTQMTALCLSASFCFVTCVTPSMILLIGRPYWNKPEIHWYAIAKSITNQVRLGFNTVIQQLCAIMNILMNLFIYHTFVRLRHYLYHIYVHCVTTPCCGIENIVITWGFIWLHCVSKKFSRLNSLYLSQILTDFQNLTKLQSSKVKTFFETQCSGCFCKSKRNRKQAWQNLSYFSRLHCTIYTYNMAASDCT